MGGFGSNAAGSSFSGVATPQTSDGPSGGLFLDATTGRTLNCRKLDPVTGDYLYNADGRAEGDSSMSQIVQLAITTAIGTSSVLGFGEDRSSIDKITDDYQQRSFVSVQAALQRYIDAGLVALLSVETEQLSDRRVQRRIRWRDLTTGSEQVVNA